MEKFLSIYENNKHKGSKKEFDAKRTHSLRTRSRSVMIDCADKLKEIENKKGFSINEAFTTLENLFKVFLFS
jgi:glycerophosphodiester phosphodiesterase